MRSTPWLVSIVAVGFGMAAAHAQPPGPVGHWTLDDAASAHSAADASGHGNVGRCGASLAIGSGQSTPAHCPAFGAAGQIGNAADFKGGDLFVVANSIPGSFTVSAWLRTTQAGDGDVNRPAYAGTGIVWSDVAGAAADMIPMALESGHLVFGTADCGNDNYDTLASNARVNTGQWVFVAVTRDQTAGAKQIYIDGKLDGQHAKASTCRLDANKVIAVGGNPLDSRYYEGEMDDLRFDDRVLSASEIMALASPAGAPPAATAAAKPAPKAAAVASGIPAADLPKLGAPVYPGAVLDGDYGPNKYVSEPGHIDAHLITDDPFDKVCAFYKQHMPAKSAKPYSKSDVDAKFEIGNFGDANYLLVSIMPGSPADPSTGMPATGTQIDIVRYTSHK